MSVFRLELLLEFKMKCGTVQYFMRNGFMVPGFKGNSSNFCNINAPDLARGFSYLNLKIMIGNKLNTVFISLFALVAES